MLVMIQKSQVFFFNHMMEKLNFNKLFLAEQSSFAVCSQKLKDELDCGILPSAGGKEHQQAKKKTLSGAG